jgi:hypothetical protein
MARTKQSSPIIPPARRFHHVINSDKVFGTHRRQMLKTETLLVIIFILGSAIAVKASVFYSFGMPSTEYMSALTDPMGLP